MIKKLILVSVVLFASYSVTISQKVVDYEVDGNRLTVKCQGIEYKIEAYTDKIVRIGSLDFESGEKDSSFTVILKRENVNVRIEETSEGLIYRTDSLTLKISSDYFGIEFIKDERVLTKHIKNSYFKSGDIKGNYFSLDEEEGIYGLGLKAVDINRRNLNTILYNQNLFGYEEGESWLNSNVPLYISSGHYAMFFDNHALHYYSADLSSPNTIKYNVNSGNMNYFFIAGNHYGELMSSYYKLTGQQPLLPRWSCGFMLSKNSYGNQENCMKIVNAMLQGEYPLDGLVFDYSWFGYAEKMGNFTWESSEYPFPTKLISDFKKKGIKSILISEPFIAQKSENYSEAVEKNLFVKDINNEEPSVNILGADVVLLDIFKKETKEWIWEKYDDRIKDGIEGWWIDLIEPEFQDGSWKFEIGKGLEHHNIYSLIWAKNLYENYREKYPAKRPYLMYRAGWAGSQRYGSILLCGDEARSWKALKGQIPGMLGMQMSGLPIFSTDIGGFSGYEINSELYIRWFQFGTFTPIMRLHMGGTSRVEPFNHNIRTQEIVRDFIKLRYRMLPYNYTIFWENSEFGVPPARPMNYYYDDVKFRNTNDQYFWGKELLVAPVADTNVRERDVFLPEGKWIDFWTKEIYQGNSNIMVAAPLETIPIFIKSGSFMPFIPQIYNTDDYRGDTLLIEYYPDIENPLTEYTIYEDDGHTAETNKTGQFQLIKFFGKVQTDSILITQTTTGQYPEMPQSREIFLKIYYPINKDFDIKINNQKVEKALTQEIFSSLSESYYFERDNNILEIHYRSINNDNEIIIAGVTSNIDDSCESKKIKIYPQPGNEYINLEICGLNKGKYSLTIFNTEGRKIYDNIDINIADEQSYYLLDLNKYNKIKISGVYYIHIFGDDFEDTVTVRVVR